MKLSIAVFLMGVSSLVSLASPMVCPPILTPDGEAVNPACPGLGSEVFSIPDTTWQVWFNDNKHGGDFDFNDLVFSVDFNSAGNQGVVTFMVAASALNNKLYFGNQFLFSDDVHPNPVTISVAANMEVKFNLVVPGNDGGSYYDGPGSRNADYKIHAWVDGQSTAPEPATAGLIGIGFILLGLFGNRFRKK